MKKIEHSVFWPIFFLMLTVCGYSLWKTDDFIQLTTRINTWILNSFGKVISVSVLIFLLLTILAYVSPFGRLKIGGANAQPLLTKWKWFSITLCTTIATGILFWGTAEPLFHLHSPEPGLHLTPGSEGAIRFSISTMFMHWTFIPYGIYTMAGLMFAWAYYNLKQPFSLGAMIYPIAGKNSIGPIGKLVDTISLFSLIAGMAASLGAGLIILAGGLETLFGIPYSMFTLGIMAVLVVATFVLSAVSGLQKGIRILSDINIKIFIGIAVFVLVFGPTWFMIKWGVIGLWDFFTHFFSKSLVGFSSEGNDWANNWTVFYWSNWLAWTPITALFLGKIAKGYTVREFIRINLLYPSLFGIAWMTIFSNTALYFDSLGNSNPLYALLVQEGGVSKVIFATLNELPLAQLTSIVFLLAAFLSYVTAADSNTSAMSGISSVIPGDGTDEPYVWMKVVWGVLVGTIAWVMISFSGTGKSSGLDGIRMLSNLGGLPSLFLMLVVALGLGKTVWASWKKPN